MEQEEKKLKKPEESKSIRKSTLTPDSIMNKLFSIHSTAHYYHLQTTSYAQHKMLNDLYEGLEDSKDDICEYLLGVQVPKRFGPLVHEPTAGFSDSTLRTFLDTCYKFSVSLCEYAKENNYEQLCNLASDLQGLIVKSQYLNTLK